jgi:ferredoxin-NADP reductase
MGVLNRKGSKKMTRQLGRRLLATYYSGLVPLPPDPFGRTHRFHTESGRYMADHFQLRLVDSRMLAPSVRHLVFERVDGQPLAFQPGQFLQVHFHYDDGTATKRSYSVATVGDGASPVERIEIAVSYVEGGAATKLLGELPHGGIIDASGPYGRFCLQEADTHPRYLLLATGTGVTPYRAMLPQIANCCRKGWP